MQEIEDLASGKLDEQVLADFGSPSPVSPGSVSQTTQPFALPLDSTPGEEGGAPKASVDDVRAVSFRINLELRFVSLIGR